jgi:predicted RNase H-like HicB family nuclease
VDVSLDKTKPENFDALLLPGGVINPDKLRMDPKAVSFVKSFFTANKPVAAICHGPWTIIEADQARGRRIASWPSLKTDLRNAGAEWIDQESVVDGNLVSSRKPDDIPAFNRAMIDLFSGSRTKVCCPSLQGCYSQGDTYEQAIENIKDAIRLHVQDRLADGEEIPQLSVSLSTVEIAV